MRELARDKGRLQDIIDYSNNVIELIEGVSCDDLAMTLQKISELTML